MHQAFPYRGLMCTAFIQGASNLTKEMFQTWFNIPNVRAFSQKYPLSHEFETNGKYDNNLARHHYGWSKKVGIRKTPTFFVNGYLLPRQYEIKDLKILVPSLAEQFDELVTEKNKIKAEIVPNLNRGI